MTASADKVQFLLQNSLQQTLPLFKKGIFDQQQLRSIMLQRQKHENKLYSSTFKLSHFLKAIQFEYQLQRQRLYRIKNQQQQNVNPLFKKQGKTDYSIIKRIIKLWDRTMHKYRYRMYLWKQYLIFCIVIKSKKHFYKALTNALRFLPFQLELWKIGVRYEVQIGRNLWKARKLFHKGLKLIPAGQKNIHLTKQLIKFELEFVQTLQSRQKIIQGKQLQRVNNMKFIIGQKNQSDQQSQNSQNQGIVKQQASQLLNLKLYDQILFVALVDSITKNCKSEIYFHKQPNLSPQQAFYSICNIYIKFLNELLDEEQNQLLKHILTTTIKNLQTHRQQTKQLKIEEKQQEINQQNNEIQVEQSLQEEENQRMEIQVEEQGQQVFEEDKKQVTKEEKQFNKLYDSYLKTKKFDKKLFIDTIKSYCLKPTSLTIYLNFAMISFFSQSLNILLQNQWICLPLKSLQTILSSVTSTQQSVKQYLLPKYSKFFIKQFKKINPTEFIGNIQVLRQIIKYYKYLNKIEEHNILFRSILVNCKQNVEFLQRVKVLFTE